MTMVALAWSWSGACLVEKARRLSLQALSLFSLFGLWGFGVAMDLGGVAVAVRQFLLCRLSTRALARQKGHFSSTTRPVSQRCLSATLIRPFATMLSVSTTHPKANDKKEKRHPSDSEEQQEQDLPNNLGVINPKQIKFIKKR